MSAIKEQNTIYDSISEYSHINDDDFIKQKKFFKQKINLLNEDFQLKLIKKNCEFLSFIKNPNFEFYKKALKINEYAVKYITNPSEVLQKYIKSHHCNSIHLINNPIFEIELELMSDIYGYLNLIKPSKEAQNALLKKTFFKKSIEMTNKLLSHSFFALQYDNDYFMNEHLKLIYSIIKNKHSQSQILFYIYNNIESTQYKKIISTHKNFKNNISYILEQIDLESI